MTFTSTQNNAPGQRTLPDNQDTAAPHEIEYRRDAAHYVSSMLTELRQIAGKAGFDKLVTALDAAYYEAYGALGSQSKQAAATQAAKSEDPEKISGTMEPTGH